MVKICCAVTVALTISVPAVVGQPRQKGPAQPGRLSAQIGVAKPQLYKSIRDAKDWENPYLVIRRDGIEVIAKGLLSGSQTVNAADLQRTLIELPVIAWPYGKVVGVQDIGIREPDGSDEQLINDHRRATLAILKILKVTVERWPS